MSDVTKAQRKRVERLLDARYGVVYRSFIISAMTEFYASREDAEARMAELNVECLLVKVEKGVVLTKQEKVYR